ncbi:MAG: hypothetical protein IT436_10070 [Phycisphaerales bacterium]|nr:hypothetical protein [Phycisphaerales bacterium]
MMIPRSASLVLAGVGLLLANIASAQPKRPDGRRELPQVKVADAPTTTVEMADDPFALDTVGMSIRLPVGARAETTSFGGQTSVQVIPPDSTWLIRIQTPRVPNKTMSALEVATEAMNQLLASVSVEDQKGGVLGTFGQVLKEPHEVNLSQKAARFYVWLPNSAKSSAVVRGYTVFKTGPDQFCAFDLTTAEPEFGRVQGIYEATIATATFTDSIELSESRGKLVKAGLGLFKGLSDKEYRELIGDGAERWERLYRPSKTGAVNDDEEIAYRRIRAWVGKRGDLDPERTKGTGTAADKRVGYLVQMDARGVDGRTVIDSRAVYFMSPDRSEEAWVVRNALKEPKGEPLVSSEIGGRTGESVSVTTSTSATPSQTIRPLIQGQGYISGFESVMLPRLLTRAATPGEYGFYAYQSKAGMIRLRRDVVEQPADRPGVWKITSKLGEDQKPQVAYYTAEGKLIRTELPDGSVWEPIELDRLVQIWRNKGLPTD